MLNYREKQKDFSTDPNLLPEDSIGYQIERRRSKRMHVALPVILKIETPEKIIETRAIATNISEGGLFAEYLDLETAHQIEKLDPLRGLKVSVQIFPSANFPEEYHLEGEISRNEWRKKQLGLGIQFVSESN